MSNITRYRGDTRRIRRTVTADGVAVNITGWDFVLTVNREHNPDDAAEQVAQIVGVIDDAANGVVDFTPALTDVATAGNYYYDIEATDASGSVSTLDKGAFTLVQDITKNNEIVWQPGVGRTGETPDPDGSQGQGFAFNASGYPQTFETVDGLECLTGTMRAPDYFMPSWGKAPMVRALGWELTADVYLDNAMASLHWSDCQYGWGLMPGIVLDLRRPTEQADSTFWCQLNGIYGSAENTATFDVTGWNSTPDWFVVGVRLNLDASVEVMVKKRGEADNWQATYFDDGRLPVPSAWALFTTFYANTAASGDAGRYGLYQIKWRRLTE